jgi:cellulose synthase/poly-beta-1,6-N-acetylglucosamine synthase-like glycosyltransferase
MGEPLPSAEGIPDVSIVIPAYNVADYLVPAIGSALGQREAAIEVIVVDDGSTDRTPEVIASFFSDSRLRVIRQTNAGLSAARNTGIAAARGRYVGFLDGDDVWMPDKASRHAALLDANPQVDLTYSWWRLVDDDGQPLRNCDCAIPAEDIRHGLTLEGLIIENFAGNGSTVVCRKDALVRTGGFDPVMRKSCEDMDAWLRVAALRPGNIALVPEVLTLYRHRQGQMTQDWRRMLEGWETAVGKAKLVAPERVAQVERWARARILRYLAYTSYELGDHVSARDLIVRAWREAPIPLLSDRQCWFVTLGSAAAALLPASLHQRIDARVKARLRRGLPGSPLGAGS